MKLLLAIDMLEHEEIWHVTLIPWKDFSKILVDGPGHPGWFFLWDKTDIILGGLNFEADFLYVFLDKKTVPTTANYRNFACQKHNMPLSPQSGERDPIF